MPLNFPRAHAARVHRNDLVVKAGETRLPFADNFRLVATVAIARGLQRHFSKITLQRFRRRAIARVAAVVAGWIVFLVAEVFGHLGLHRPLQKRLRQLLQQAVFSYDVFWLLVVRQQLVDEFEVDRHRVPSVWSFRWPFTQFTLYPPAPICSTSQNL